MGKHDATATTTADADASPEIITETRRRSFENPLSAFRKFKVAEAAKVPTATPTPDRMSLAPTSSDSMPASSALEQDTFIGMMRATHGMSPEEVKTFLERKAQVDQEKYKDDGAVGGLYWNRSVGNQQT